MDIPHVLLSLLTFSQILARDGYRCVRTCAFDGTSLRRNCELKKLYDDLEASPATVQAWHVLNERTMQGADPAGGGEKSTTIHNVCAVPVS